MKVPDTLIYVTTGVRQLKYILLHSNYEIAMKFKERHPDCSFKIPATIREFPQNAVPTSTCDTERNTCPIMLMQAERLSVSLLPLKEQMCSFIHHIERWQQASCLHQRM